MHQLPHRAVIDTLGGRDQRDTALAEVRHDDGVVDTVASQAGEFVDYDEVDIPLAPDTLEHLLESNSFSHLGARATRLDVLPDDLEVKLAGLAFARNALGWDGNALRVVVGVYLSGGRHAEIEDGPVAGTLDRCGLVWLLFPG
ncbi:hypothetical protein [Mycobacterium sp. 236(2023)]|uniref:hypothetical protein n=1 Tax=Mycobacterium sp. 236(2023) TaxID=3038163 RepID=UPI0024150F06|nr:hypothetical protein [Mycobacterium sp. 236(2023)]MDG4668668.1 hypothetical protein [Mycobacterium sp. 236(2023)]